MIVVVPRTEDNVLPKTAVVPQVLAIESALLVRLGEKRSAPVAAQYSTIVRDERRRHIHEVGPDRLTVSTCLRRYKEASPTRAELRWHDGRSRHPGYGERG